MAELWQRLVELLRRRPALWVPVLAADLLGYLLNLGRGSLLRLLVLHDTAQRSVLGGTVVHAPVPASALQAAAVEALLLTWFVYFLRLLLYASALVATTALVQSFVQRADHPARALGPALRRHAGGILELALRALAVYAVAAFVYGTAASSLARHGQTVLTRNPWFGFAFTLVMLLVLSLWLAPVALRVLSGQAPDRELASMAQRFSMLLVMVAALLALIVGANGRELALIQPAARYPLDAVGSLVAALPYVLLYTGLAVLAQQMHRNEDAGD